MPDLPANIDRTLLDDANHVVSDVPCVRCKYNLRTLPADGCCPECAEPVSGSICRAELAGADPVWLKRVSGALAVMTIGSLSVLGAPILAAGLPCIAPFFFIPLIGMLFLVSRDPRERGTTEGITARRLLFWGAYISILFAGVWTIAVCGEAFNDNEYYMNPLLRWLSSPGGLITSASWFLGVLPALLLAYVRYLAQRAEEMSLACWFKVLHWLHALFIVFSIAFLLLVRTPIVLSESLGYASIGTWIGLHGTFVVASVRLAAAIDRKFIPSPQAEDAP